MPQPGPSLDALIALDRQHVWHPYAAMPATSDSILVERAAGVSLELGDGRQVIDAMSSWWSTIHGYNHPALNDAARHQLDDMAHVMFGGLTHRPAIELATRLGALTPDGLDRVFFSDSGSVAVEVAIKMALQHARGRGHPERYRLLTVRSGYHGDTFAAMSVCDPETGMHHLFADTLPQQLFAPAPPPGFDAPFQPSDIEAFERLLRAHHRELAAVILEPIVQGAGGMRFYSPAYLAEVRALCTRYDTLLIADEIATGFGRTGAMFACDHADISPDIMCVGKALTGGYLSMAATLCTAEVADTISHGEGGALMHGPTFMANPLACAVAVASLDLLAAGRWPDQVRAIETALRTGLAPAREIAGVRDVRVLGSIGVIETTDPMPLDQVQAIGLEAGVWLRPFGRLLYTMPAYISTDDDVATITGAMVTIVDHLARHPIT